MYVVFTTGGLNILNPTTTACSNYTTSRRLTSTVIDALKRITTFDMDEFIVNYYTVQGEVVRDRDVALESVH